VIIEQFIGEVPVAENHLLPENAATSAVNCLYYSGGINGLPASEQNDGTTTAPLFTTLSGTANTIYSYDNGDNTFLFQFDAPNVSVVNNPLANDAYKRVYWTDGVQPKFVAKDQATVTSPYPSQGNYLGLPAPSSAPTYTIVDLADTSGGMIDTAFIYTFVSTYGEESKPSAPTSVFTSYDATQLQFNAPTVPVDYAGLVTKYRVYMLSGGYYLFLVEQDISSSATVTLDTDLLGESVTTVEYDMPPPALKGLINVSSGYLCGYFENTLCFSESYLPYAWPTKYYIPFEYNITGIVSTSNGILVGTTGKPYLVSGTSPFGMSPIEIDSVLPCVGQATMVDMGEFALYASLEGIVAMESGAAKIISDKTFSVEQWKELSPQTMRAFRFRDTYLVFTTVGKTFFFSPGSKTVTYITLPYGFRAATTNDKNGMLVLGTDNNLYRLASHATSTESFVWMSKAYPVPPNTVFSVARVRSKGTFTFRVHFYADDYTLLSTYEVTNVGQDPFRIPAVRCAFVSMEVEGVGTVRTMAIGESLEEIN
jgi:hypothetical protein